MDTRIKSRTSVVVAIIAAVLAVLGAPVAASTDGITEYPLPGRGSPQDIAAGPDGNLWFTEPAGLGIVESASAWAHASSTGAATAGKIGRITPTGTITEYPLPTGRDSYAIAAGPDGNLWFTEIIFGPIPPARHGAIGRITPTGTITEYPLPTGGDPGGIAAGPDGNLWFTEGNAIGRITPTGTITEFPLPTGGGADRIAAGPDGNLWFTRGNAIGRITPTGTITEFPMPLSLIEGIAAGPDGNMWFTNDIRIWRITPTGTITEFLVPATYRRNGQARGIAAGPDGNLWFTEQFGAIGRITPEGTFSEYKLPTYGSWPSRIAAGPDGNMWFTADKTIGRISPTATPILKWTCPINVTLHKPAPRRVGNRILTDKIRTNNFCVLPKPVVRCRPLANATVGKKASCATKATKRGKIRVNTKGYEAVRVTVIVRATPKNKPGFPGPWKRDTWRKSWLLR